MPERSPWILILAGLFFIISGCSKEKVLTIEELELIFLTNNSQASKRLQSIAYSPIDEANREERFKLVHISDMHLSTWSHDNNYNNPVNLRQSIRFANQSELNINAIVATGDYISYSPKKEAMQYMQAFASSFYSYNRIPSFLCTGNHDCNLNSPTTLADFIRPPEVNTLLFSHTNGLRQTNPHLNYYYSDVPNPQGGYIRIIALDMLDQEDTNYNTLVYASYTQEQIDWLCHTALQKDMSPEHSIIILTHYPFQPLSHGGAGSYLCDGNFVHPWNMIPEIVEAFRSRTSLQKEYPNKLLDEKTITVDVDYSDTTGEFICYLGGHAHCFATFEITDLENYSSDRNAQQMILCTNQSPSETGTIYNRVRRERNSTISNSFNIYAIDTREKNIYITFFGAYQPEDDRSFPEVLTVKY